MKRILSLILSASFISIACQLIFISELILSFRLPDVIQSFLYFCSVYVCLINFITFLACLLLQRKKVRETRFLPEGFALPGVFIIISFALYSIIYYGFGIK